MVVYKHIFTGFDSAWGRQNQGALCHLGMRDDGNLEFLAPPNTCGWPEATAWSSGTAWPNHVIAIDQGLVVVNETKQRPVERQLASALMARFRCGAHSSNTARDCYGPGAGIWDFVEALEANGYRQDPMAVADRSKGRYYFECFPHPALIGLFDLDKILKYKVKHRNPAAWRKLLELLRSLETRSPRLLGIGAVVAPGLAQTKVNEDKVDSIIAAYVAAFWWTHGTSRSVSIGSLSSGYLVTPYSSAMRKVLDQAFGAREQNERGIASSKRPDSGATASAEAVAASSLPMGSPALGVAMEVDLICSDTSNLWQAANPWMDRFENISLSVVVLDADSAPALRFVPFRRDGERQRGMRISDSLEHRAEWVLLAAGASKRSPITYRARVEYEPPEPDGAQRLGDAEKALIIERILHLVTTWDARLNPRLKDALDVWLWAYEVDAVKDGVVLKDQWLRSGNGLGEKHFERVPSTASAREEFAKGNLDRIKREHVVPREKLKEIVIQIRDAGTLRRVLDEYCGVVLVGEEDLEGKAANGKALLSSASMPLDWDREANWAMPPAELPDRWRRYKDARLVPTLPNGQPAFTL